MAEAKAIAANAEAKVSEANTRIAEINTKIAEIEAKHQAERRAERQAERRKEYIDRSIFKLALGGHTAEEIARELSLSLSRVQEVLAD